MPLSSPPRQSANRKVDANGIVPEQAASATVEMARSSSEGSTQASAAGRKLQHQESESTAVSGGHMSDSTAGAIHVDRTTQYLRFETMSDAHGRVCAPSHRCCCASLHCSQTTLPAARHVCKLCAHT